MWLAAIWNIRRIFSFGTGKEQKIYIGSADMMTRNTEKRVEVACPVLDGQIRRQINHDLKIMLNDNVKARIMQKDGTYMKRTGGIKAVDSQAAFMEEASKAVDEVDRSQQRTRENCGDGRVTGLFPVPPAQKKIKAIRTEKSQLVPVPWLTKE